MHGEPPSESVKIQPLRYTGDELPTDQEFPSFADVEKAELLPNRDWRIPVKTPQVLDQVHPMTGLAVEVLGLVFKRDSFTLLPIVSSNTALKGTIPEHFVGKTNNTELSRQRKLAGTKRGPTKKDTSLRGSLKRLLKRGLPPDEAMQRIRLIHPEHIENPTYNDALADALMSKALGMPATFDSEGVIQTEATEPDVAAIKEVFAQTEVPLVVAQKANPANGPITIASIVADAVQLGGGSGEEGLQVEGLKDDKKRLEEDLDRIEKQRQEEEEL